MALDTITREEFDKRLDDANERLRQDLADAQDRVHRLEALIHRKEVFAQKLDTILAEIEREESEIATAEKELRSRQVVRRRFHAHSSSV